MEPTFSPVPKKRIGTFKILIKLKAAPARASESILVKMIPVKFKWLWNSLATLITSWPDIESTTKKISSGWIFFFNATSSLINFSSVWSRPAVSKMLMLMFFSLIWFKASSAIFNGSPWPSSMQPMLMSVANCFNWSMAAAR